MEKNVDYNMDLGTDEETKVVEKPFKHLKLVKAINGLYNISSALQQLLYKIKLSEEGEVLIEQEAVIPMSLAELLNTGPSIIINRQDEIFKLLIAIEDELF